MTDLTLCNSFEHNLIFVWGGGVQDPVNSPAPGKGKRVATWFSKAKQVSAKLSHIVNRVMIYYLHVIVVLLLISGGHITGRHDTHRTLSACPLYHNMSVEDCKVSPNLRLCVVILWVAGCCKPFVVSSAWLTWKLSNDLRLIRPRKGKFAFSWP